MNIESILHGNGLLAPFFEPLSYVDHQLHQPVSKFTNTNNNVLLKKINRGMARSVPNDPDPSLLVSRLLCCQWNSSISYAYLLPHHN